MTNYEPTLTHGNAGNQTSNDVDDRYILKMGARLNILYVPVGKSGKNKPSLLCLVNFLELCQSQI